MTVVLDTNVLLQIFGQQSPRRDIARSFELTSSLHGNIKHVAPSFQFQVITADPDDNAFVDCAIAGNADYIVTEDHHFDVLIESGYQPQPIHPQVFIERMRSNK